MPGKVNPTQSEALTQVAVQIHGNNAAMSFAGSQGHFELNVYNPVMAYNFLQSVRLLADAAVSFTDNCVVGIEPRLDNIKRGLENSLMLVTPLKEKVRLRPRRQDRQERAQERHDAARGGGQGRRAGRRLRRHRAAGEDDRAGRGLRLAGWRDCCFTASRRRHLTDDNCTISDLVPERGPGAGREQGLWAVRGSATMRTNLHAWISECRNASGTQSAP